MSTSERPYLRVVRGNPNDAELAALTAVLAAASAAAPVEEPRQPSAWANRAAQLRRPLHPGPGAWRGSALPQ
ncbi:MAG: acyl-CoA carboxylase subunit epsilon [Sciscionella sp.]|nr:acyl-CoA carboxylase subunit epsilon [Sciscionella sp.]